jgi:hypothetical protein
MEIGPARLDVIISSTFATATGRLPISLPLTSGNAGVTLFTTHNIAHAGIQKSTTAVTAHETQSNNLKQLSVSQL